MARILIVEDSPAMRAYIRSTLEDRVLGLAGDVDIVEAVNGFDALRLLPRGAFDLVITDINMPDINGLEVIRFVRQSDRYRHVAILIISTQATERDIQRGLRLGADRFLPKPFTPEALRDAVVASLEARAEAPQAGASPSADGAHGADDRASAASPRAEEPAARTKQPGSGEGGGG
ncbi:response regulator [Sorangium sp. So ce367]|uniref:response regulator n=1 Tax=Sorangium sp. So ce367 TaxID=3133305 RepID=UPI003F5F40EE